MLFNIMCGFLESCCISDQLLTNKQIKAHKLSQNVLNTPRYKLSFSFKKYQYADIKKQCAGFNIKRLKDVMH